MGGSNAGGCGTQRIGAGSSGPIVPGAGITLGGERTGGNEDGSSRSSEGALAWPVGLPSSKADDPTQLAASSLCLGSSYVLDGFADSLTAPEQAGVHAPSVSLPPSEAYGAVEGLFTCTVNLGSVPSGNRASAPSRSRAVMVTRADPWKPG